MGAATGPDAIAKMVAAGFERCPVAVSELDHVMTSFDVEVNGDAATAWSRWTWVVVGANGKPQTERAGHYEDTWSARAETGSSSPVRHSPKSIDAEGRGPEARARAVELDEKHGGLQ